MSKLSFIPLAALSVAALVVGSMSPEAQAVPGKGRVDKRQIARGEYLVKIMGCNDCHTPFKLGPNGPEPDMERALTGHPEAVVMPAAPALDSSWVWAGAGTNTAFAGPWGVSFAANLRPDPETGTGTWTTQMFIDTIRNGRHLGRGRPILPPMPWPMYRNATDEDLTAIFAYLQSLPPVVNRVPQPIELTTGAVPAPAKP